LQNKQASSTEYLSAVYLLSAFCFTTASYEPYEFSDVRFDIEHVIYWPLLLFNTIMIRPLRPIILIP